MNKLLLILLFTLVIQTCVKANDIKDYQIEGMSIGDSLLNFYDKDEVNSMIKTIYPGDEKYFKIDSPLRVGDYDSLSFHLKKNDPKFIIYELSGAKFFDNDISECLKHKEKVSSEIKSITKELIKNSYRYDYKYFEKGKSYAEIDDYDFDNGDSIRLYCVNWSKLVEDNYNFGDNFNISLSPKEHTDWLRIANKNN
jgi:hypothetical protein